MRKSKAKDCARCTSQSQELHRMRRSETKDCARSAGPNAKGCTGCAGQKQKTAQVAASHGRSSEKLFDFSLVSFQDFQNVLSSFRSTENHGHHENHWNHKKIIARRKKGVNYFYLISSYFYLVTIHGQCQLVKLYG